jgi:EpsD family peptidyl-prolyl cis-trans isomerase
LGLSACTEGKTVPQNPQLVATVNGNELSMPQLNYVKNSDAPQDEKAATTRIDPGAVDSLIDQELLVQEALKRKLDKDETVMMELDRARRQILARAYLEQVVFPKAPVPANEAREFYERHPALFKQHRTFQFVNFTIAQEDANESLKAAVTRAHSPQALRRVLDRLNIGYDITRSAVSAEQLPMNQLEELSHAKVGDVVVSAQDGKVALMSVARIEETPQSFASAQAVIERYLTNVRNERATEDYLKKARAGAQITRFKDISSSFAVNRPAAAASSNPFAVSANE